ncbi:hypothetical protein BJ979_002791 [Schumannella luteola]|uniref:Uncharacterized protein n=1 Tax=Schumannella luteola TaxID=472059 RepID=A0A852YSD1_9MICO|nr:hypothetical protein [Schumannella luteola]
MSTGAGVDRGTSPGDDALTVSVTRSGGVAGIRREWRIDVDGDGRADWILLLDACPWSSADVGGAPDAAPGAGSTAAGASAPRGADRMTWTIAADGPEQPRRAELPEPELTGPWRELVDRVQRDGQPVSARVRALPGEDRPIKHRPVEPRDGA